MTSNEVFNLSGASGAEAGDDAVYAVRLESLWQIHIGQRIAFQADGTAAFAAVEVHVAVVGVVVMVRGTYLIFRCAAPVVYHVQQPFLHEQCQRTADGGAVHGVEFRLYPLGGHRSRHTVKKFKEHAAHRRRAHTMLLHSIVRIFAHREDSSGSQADTAVFGLVGYYNQSDIIRLYPEPSWRRPPS